MSIARELASKMIKPSNMSRFVLEHTTEMLETKNGYGIIKRLCKEHSMDNTFSYLVNSKNKTFDDSIAYIEKYM